MRIRRHAYAAVLALMACAAHAGPWEDGYADYQRKDYAAAVAKWRSVAESGNREAQSLLGIMYAFGQGVPQDYPQAITWLHLAAAQGETKAQFKLGSMYANGQGFARNHQRAAMWFTIAAEGGHPKARAEMAKSAQEISASELATAKRLAKTCIKRAFQGCE
ncbi:MAG: tetratricopeptide repeat protein [Rhodoferax sp.]|nr:tetratricopeptide repeat protein [Rhodoferax sp.]